MNQSCPKVKPMDRQTVKEALRAFGVTQTDLARAAGLSEAAISRQLNGGLRLTRQVTNAAEGLLVQRGADVAARILDWVEFRRFAIARTKETEGNDDA